MLILNKVILDIDHGESILKNDFLIDILSELNSSIS